MLLQYNVRSNRIEYLFLSQIVPLHMSYTKELIQADYCDDAVYLQIFDTFKSSVREALH
jgi:hypothetical protein